ncbi:hypothetical protein N7461_005823 [Penicillium sp. DV-2018c]|nr:hypothetical protein N7461_005823 [Penicillium sp. DV-2018c]
MVLCFAEEYLPKDPVFPDDLEKLGFFLTKDDKIRIIEAPNQGPRYKIDRNDRVNQVHIEALHKCLRRLVIDRLVELNMDVVKYSEGPNAPIIMSRDFNNVTRVVVHFGELIEDIGIFSYREICDDGIPFGSAVGLAKAVLQGQKDPATTALILANVGQHVWHNESNVAMTTTSFYHRAQSSIVEQRRLANSSNKVANNKSLDEHVRYIFEDVLMCHLPVGAKIDVLGMSEGGAAAMSYLSKRWNIWRPHIACMALINPGPLSDDLDVGDATDNKSFAHFFQTRCRAWVLSDLPIGTLVDGGRDDYGCNTYSCGEDRSTSSMITRGLGHICSWMKIMNQCPLAKEGSSVVPGSETKLSRGCISATHKPTDTPPSLINGSEVDDRTVMELFPE